MASVTQAHLESPPKEEANKHRGNTGMCQKYIKRMCA